MCGIVGVIPKLKNGFNYVHQKMFYQLLYADALRGQDATGVITVHKNGDFGIMKEAVDSYTFNGSFVDSDLDKDLYQNGMAVVGHNRAKTVGENTDENAHPFVIDNTFAMVHNGTLRNHHELTKTAVDSEALAIEFHQAMGQEDWKEGMETALGKVRGALACVWFDQKRMELCLIRNTERPMALLELDDCFLFGSELSMLFWIANRNNEKVVVGKNLEIHKLYQFDMEKGGGVYSETFLSPKYPVWQHKGFSNGVSAATHTPTSTTSTGTTDIPSADVVVTEVKGVSKNQFKKIKGLVFQKEIEWLCEDFVEGSAGSYLVMGRSVNGAYDLCDVIHSIKGQILLDDDKILWDNGITLKGTIKDVEYDKEHKAVLITMEKLTVAEHEKTIH